MERLEFPLAQGWAKGLVCCFENASSSQRVHLENAFHVQQIHGDELYEVSSQDLLRKEILATADGLVARGETFKQSRRPLVIKTADCLPLFFIDIENQAVAAVHAGWRGLQKGIHRKPFEKAGFDPKSTWIWVGPSLNGKNFEVGRDMWSQFSCAEDERFFEKTSNPEKRFFYAWNFIESEMKSFGVPLVYNVEVDTFADKDFASYRRNKSASDPTALATRNLSWIGFT